MELYNGGQPTFDGAFALTLRGPSGGHCVELKRGWGVARMGEARDTLGARRAPSVSRSNFVSRRLL